VAIAFSSATFSGLLNNLGSGTANYSFTAASVTNGLLVVWISSSQNVISGISYSGQPLTNITTFPLSSGGFMHCWALVNPPAGTANITITFSSIYIYYQLSPTLYSGAKQSIPSLVTSSSVTATSITETLTTTADNSWLAAWFGELASGFTFAAGTGTTQRTIGAGWITGDSGGPKTPPGSYSMTGTITGGAAQIYGIMIAIEPPAAAYAPVSLPLMGCQ
jgi:hypothetical protein